MFDFLFQYSEVKSKGALQTYETYINELKRSDRLVQEDEELCTVLLNEKDWIKGKDKFASSHDVKKRRADIDRKVSFYISNLNKEKKFLVKC